MKMTLTHAERVANGVQYLMDTHKGGLIWLDLIDIDKLDMVSPGWCVIGQVFGSYWGWSSTSNVDPQGQRELGFEAEYDRGNECMDWNDYDALQAEWTRVLLELKEV